MLTSDQHAQLRELIRDPGAVAKLEEELKNRITAKVDASRKERKNGRKAVAIRRPLPGRCKRKSVRSWIPEESSKPKSRLIVCWNSLKRIRNDWA